MILFVLLNLFKLCCK